MNTDEQNALYVASKHDAIEQINAMIHRDAHGNIAPHTVTIMLDKEHIGVRGTPAGFGGESCAADAYDTQWIKWVAVAECWWDREIDNTRFVRLNLWETLESKRGSC